MKIFSVENSNSLKIKHLKWGKQKIKYTQKESGQTRKLIRSAGKHIFQLVIAPVVRHRLLLLMFLSHSTHTLTIHNSLCALFEASACSLHRNSISPQSVIFFSYCDCKNKFNFNCKTIESSSRVRKGVATCHCSQSLLC